MEITSASEGFTQNLALWEGYLNQNYSPAQAEGAAAGHAALPSSDIEDVASQAFSYIQHHYEEVRPEDIQRYFKLIERTKSKTSGRITSLFLEFSRGDRLFGTNAAVAPYLSLFGQSQRFGASALLMDPIKDSFMKGAGYNKLEQSYSQLSPFSLNEREKNDFLRETAHYRPYFEALPTMPGKSSHLERESAIFKAGIAKTLISGKKVHFLLDTFSYRIACREEPRLNSREDYFHTWANLKFLYLLCNTHPEFRDQVHFWRYDAESQAPWKGRETLWEHRITDGDRNFLHALFTNGGLELDN